MHSHGCALSCRRLSQPVLDSHFINGMAGLMNHRKQRAVQAVFVMSGNPHIMIVETGGKGMGAFCKNTLSEIKADILCQVFSQLSLPVLRIISGQKFIRNPDRTFHHLMQQRNQLLLQQSEKLVQLLHAKSFLVGIQHNIIQPLPLLCPVSGKGFLPEYDFFQSRCKGLKIFLFSCSGPDSG